MRVFSCPAGYRRVVEAQLAIGLAEIGRDVERRDRGGFRSLPLDLIDPSTPGVVIIVCDDTMAEHVAAALDPDRVRVG